MAGPIDRNIANLKQKKELFPDDWTKENEAELQRQIKAKGGIRDKLLSGDPVKGGSGGGGGDDSGWLDRILKILKVKKGPRDELVPTADQPTGLKGLLKKYADPAAKSFIQTRTGGFGMPTLEFAKRLAAGESPADVFSPRPFISGLTQGSWLGRAKTGYKGYNVAKNVANVLGGKGGLPFGVGSAALLGIPALAYMMKDKWSEADLAARPYAQATEQFDPSGSLGKDPFGRNTRTTGGKTYRSKLLEEKANIDKKIAEQKEKGTWKEGSWWDENQKFTNKALTGLSKTVSETAAMEDIGIGGGEGGLKDRPGPSGQTVAQTAATEDININQAPVFTPYTPPVAPVYTPPPGPRGGQGGAGGGGGMGRGRDPGGGTTGSPFAHGGISRILPMSYARMRR